MAIPKRPTTVMPRFVHPIQPIHTDSEDLKFTTTEDEQLHIFDEITFEQDVTFGGDLIVMSSDYVPDVDKNAGVVVQPTYTDNGDGSFTIGDDGIYNLYSSLDTNTPIITYSLPGITQSLADGELGYVYVDYNGGSPLLKYATDRTLVRDGYLATTAIVRTIGRDGSSLKTISCDHTGIALSEKRLDRAFDTEARYSHSLTAGGIIIENVGATVFKVTAGTLWTVTNPIDLDESVSNVATTVLHYKDALGVWQKTLVTGFNNTQYQSASGLSTLAANRFAVNWIWIDTTSGDLCVVLGDGNYKLIEAQASARPIPPPMITAFGFFVGRIIVEKSSTTPTQIDNSLTTGFAQAAATIHSDLLGLDGGETGYYGHLSQDEMTTVDNIQHQIFAKMILLG